MYINKCNHDMKFVQRIPRAYCIIDKNTHKDTYVHTYKYISKCYPGMKFVPRTGCAQEKIKML